MEKKHIALTFDDGPNITTTVAMLDLLQQTGVPASFFLVGNNITDQTIPVVQRAFAMGCEIDNHSVSHTALTVLTPAQMLAEVQPVTRRITEITGTPPRFFRPPYIATNPTVFATVPLPMICGFGVEDYNDAISAEERFCRLTEGATDGMILLLHDSEGNDKTVQAVAKLIPTLQAQGYEFVTLSRLFDLKQIHPRAHDGQIYSVL